MSPPAAGMYDPLDEHDGCGVALVATTTRSASHTVVARALEVLGNLAHRGAVGSDAETGDGAGMLLQLPHELLERSAGVALPEPGCYGAGMVFLPREPEARRVAEALVECACTDEDLRVLGWDDVEIDPSALGAAARASMPVIRRLLVASVGLRGAELERRLYVLRRVVERDAAVLPEDSRPYLCSLSSRTMVFKGMLTAAQLERFYRELGDASVRSRLAVVHARFSTNTLPRWRLAQPFRTCAHNGEINTIRGNQAWMRARRTRLRSPVFGGDLDKLRPVLDESGSDSMQFDNALELLTMAGRPVHHGIVMMIPEAWEHDERMDPAVRAFYEFHSHLLEPWDGPAAIVFTDGAIVGATLDRNGLRPARWCTTRDGLVVLASEAGVIDVPPADVTARRRLEPGRLLLVDTERGRILDDAAVKRDLAHQHPYATWIRRGTVHLDELPGVDAGEPPDAATLAREHARFGYTDEDLTVLLAPIAASGEEPAGSMGNDTPPAVLSATPRPLFDYFKQQFAQVTNPPIDPIRERAVMSLRATLGSGGNLLDQGPAQAQRLVAPSPILRNRDVEKLRHGTQRQFPVSTLRATFPSGSGEAGLREALRRLQRAASERVRAGCTVLILSDRGGDAGQVPIPSLLATSAAHHHLVREGTRTGVGLVVESGEPREVMHCAALIGYGAEAVNPYLALDTFAELERRELLPDGVDAALARRRFLAAIDKGLLKTLARMGISTVQSYCGAQVFEAVGIARDVVDEFFPGTRSRIGGAGLAVFADEAQRRHDAAHGDGAAWLGDAGMYRWRRDGEHHQWNPETIATLQHAVKTGDDAWYRRYADAVHEEATRTRLLRGLLEPRAAGEPVGLDEVEPADAIVRRFASGAMSFGSISREAHETIAIGMNRIGARSNTGEGGEDASRFTPDRHGALRRSAIKQVASARFGVTAHYLVNADELQIKIAQGAKPGEGGQLPGHKVDAVIARLRHSTPGVGLISPPPHHDIYSIEDLAQLIHDLRCVNPHARISVKLVAEGGVGTVAAGCVKAGADHLVISGYEGGTGASPLSSIRHAGVPWELGLAETQQVLVDHGLRARVTLQADGQMKTGRDVLVAALLGADEFGFATAVLVATGCVMMRVCHLNTCPVGIATQDQELRRRYAGTPEQVVRFMHFVAEDVRERLAALGLRSLQDAVGRTELLRDVAATAGRGVDLAPLLHRPATGAAIRCERTEPVRIGEHVDRGLIELGRPALDRGEPVELAMTVHNRDRAVGTMLSGEIARRHGARGLPDGSIVVDAAGSAGQSFGAWLAPGVTLLLEGETNDHCGKGLSGGRIAVRPPADAGFAAEDAVITGNVALYGATSGEAFFRGVAGERFAVRNSGATAVVEGVGDHGCEYMTGGTVVVLGPTGRNFAAGMSGGVAYVLDGEACGADSGDLLDLDGDDEALLRTLLERHLRHTGSTVAADLLAQWPSACDRFVKVLPREYRAALAAAADVDVQPALRAAG